jgi:GAF domain-containing protein
MFRAVNPVTSTERARLCEREQKRDAQLAVVNEVARRAASILDMDQLLQEVVTAIQQGFNYHNVLLAMLDEATDELEVQVIAGGFEGLIPPDYRQAVGVGMIGWTAETGQPLLANDVSQEPRYVLGFLEEPLTKAELCVPLKLTGKVIGVLDVQDTRLNVFDETDLLAMETLAAQLAVAIEKVRLYQEVQRRLEELTFLSRVGGTVTSSLDLGQILTMVMEETTLVLGVEVASILLLDEESGELVFEAAVGPRAEGMKGLRLSLGQGIAGWAAREGQPLLVPDVREDPRFYPGIDEITGFVTGSVLAVPLKVKGKVIGVIEALNKAKGDFSQADVALLSSMAQTAAIAIENAQLFAETQRRFEEMAALYDVSLDVTARLEMSELLKSIVERAVTLLGADAGSIYLYDLEREELRMVVGYDYTEKYIGITLKPGEGMAGKVFQTGEPLIADDYRVWEGGAAAFEADQPFTTILEVPLKWQERVIGVLSINADVQKRAFNQDDIWLATLFANQAAVAIENAHLYEELKQEHKRLQQAQEQMLAAERWAVLGKAAANLAHRINNTAGLIPVAIQDLKELLAGIALEEERRQEIEADLQRIERNTRFTLQMADALLKPFEALPPEECDVNALLGASISVANVPEDVVLKTGYADELPKVIASRLLADVFVELITNAVKAMPEGGELEIGSRLGGKEWVEVWFSDTGLGIPPESQDKIFDLFFTTSEDSLGFGLWWVKTFLEQHGATINVESEMGKGTTFTVRLPVKAPRQQLNSLKEARSWELKGF